MRAILLSAVAAAAVAGCTMDTADKAVVVEKTDTAVVTAPGATPVVVSKSTPVAVVKPASEPMVVPADAAAPLPILGSWRCADQGFTVTPGTYRTAGGAAIRIDSIERVGTDGYRLVLQDAKKIRLTNIVDGKLTWMHENAENGTQTMTCVKR